MSFVIAFILLVNLHFATYGYLDDTEINVLNQLYNQWNGEYWHPCTWNMTAIRNKNEDHYVQNHCALYFASYNNTNYQYVYAFNFTQFYISNVSGTLPHLLKDLSNLEWFAAYYNGFHGTIPNIFCDITRLSLFYIVGTNLTGPIPECVFKLHHITEVAIGDTNVSMNSINIETLCNNSYANKLFNSFQIFNSKYYGSIPSCIGYNLTNITYLQIENQSNLTGTIPLSVNNLTKLESLFLFSLSGIDTSHPPYINFQQFPNLHYLVIDLQIIDTNLKYLCDLYLTELGLFNYGDTNTVTIPNECIFKNKNSLFSLEIYGYAFKGSIDGLGLCSQSESLVVLNIVDTKYVNITIPDCFSDLNKLHTFTLRNNRQLYSLPKYAINSSRLSYLQIEYNQNLGGSVSHLLTNESYKYIQILALDHNNFYDTNIDNLLKHVLLQSKYLMAFTLHENNYLSGSLPTISDTKIYLDNLQILTLHNLDIHGTVSNNLYLSKNVTINMTKLITLYGNRLSGTISNNLFLTITNKQHLFDAIILPQNKFTILDTNTKTNKNWLIQNSLFLDANGLYISCSDITFSYFMSCIALLLTIIYIGCVCGNNSDVNEYEKSQQQKQKHLWLYNLTVINKILFDKYLMMLVISLTTIYAFNSNYYESNIFLSRFSLYNFYSQNTAINIILSVLILCFNIIMIVKVTQLNYNKTTFKYDLVPTDIKQV
eukprot:295475_1